MADLYRVITGTFFWIFCHSWTQGVERHVLGPLLVHFEKRKFQCQFPVLIRNQIVLGSEAETFTPTPFARFEQA